MVLADLDDDGRQEVIAVSHVGSLYVWDIDGSERWRVEIGGSTYSTAAVGDIDGDGRPEIVWANPIDVYAYRANGDLVAGFPVRTDATQLIRTTPSLADLDGDGRAEILVVARGLQINEAFSGRVYAYTYDPLAQTVSHLPGWPQVVVETDLYASASLADLDDDGAVEVVVAGTDHVWAWHAGGTAVAGWAGGVPLALPITGALTNGAGSSRASSKPAIADLNGDGALEIVVGSNVLSSAGTVLGGWEGGRPEALNSLSAALADMDGDASNGREIVLGKYAWHADGTSVSGFPLGMALSAPVVADCSGHDHLDVLAGTRNIPSAPGVTGFHAEADPHAIDGYPKSLYGETGDIGAPVVGDFDNDGLAVVAVAITDGSYGGVVAIYDMPFENHDERHEWPMLGRDVARTGFLDVTPPNRPRDLVVGNAATGIELRWQERSAVEDGYLVERSASGEPWSYVTVAADLPADTSTFTDADVIFGEVYFYRVRAFRVAHGARCTVALGAVERGERCRRYQTHRRGRAAANGRGRRVGALGRQRQLRS